MHFKLVYGNHWNFGLQVGDTFRYLKLALESAGHRADIEKQLCPGYVNIVQECFDDDYTESLLQAVGEGLELILIASEFLTKATFNRFNDENSNESSYYANREYWDKRFANFERIAASAMAIWHLCEQEVDNYQRYFSKVKVAYLPHAFVDNYRSVSHLPDEEKDIDFLFTGTLTDYRKVLLASLQNKGYKVESMHALTAPFHRDDLISRSKIALNLKQYAQWLYPSPSRFFYHIANESCVVSEAGEFECDIQRYVDTCAEANFTSFCEQILHEGCFSTKASQRLARFEVERPASKLIPELLHRSIT